MKQFIIILLNLSLISCNQAKSQNTISVDVTKDIVIPKHYIVSKTKNNIFIDGNADEASWNKAKFSDKFIDIEGIKIPKFDTKMKMLWDDNFLYVYAELEEPHIWGNLKQRDTIIYYNNDFEVFLDPSKTPFTASKGKCALVLLPLLWALLSLK